VNQTVRAFDRLASEYDTIAGGEIFRLLRERTHAAFAARFSAGARVLEIGCGTGLDTAFLGRRGVRVVACDPSEEMVSRALRRLAHEGLVKETTVVPCGLNQFASFLDALEEPAGFDGIVSNFGALNCVQHLAPLRALAHRYLRPGGAIVLGLMGRTCALEVLYFTATRRSALATRRRSGGGIDVPVGGVDVPTFYHRIADVRDALGIDNALDRVEGIGVAIPPPYLEPRWQKLPATVRTVLASIDRAIAPWPPFNRIGDHVLLHFLKRSAADA
jgi:SAM-dependent methyltransferase